MRYMGEAVPNLNAGPLPDLDPSQRELMAKTIGPQLNDNQSATMLAILERSDWGGKHLKLRYAVGGAVGIAVGVGLGALLFRRKR